MRRDWANLMHKIHKFTEQGSSLARNAVHQEHLVKIAGEIMDIDRLKWEATEKRPLVYDIRVKCDPDDEQGSLAVIRGYTPDGYVVAFHRDDTVWEVLVGVGKRLKNNSLKWKEDQYAGNKSE